MEKDYPSYLDYPLKQNEPSLKTENNKTDIIEQLESLMNLNDHTYMMKQIRESIAYTLAVVTAIDQLLVDKGIITEEENDKYLDVKNIENIKQIMVDAYDSKNS
jgi:hypothetical protein